jgi:hypothetical protein
VVRDHARLRAIMRDGARPCATVRDHARRCATVRGGARPWLRTQLRLPRTRGGQSMHINQSINQSISNAFMRDRNAGMN